MVVLGRNVGTTNQIIAAVSGTLFAISDGMTYGWTAPFIPYLLSEESHLKTDEHQAEWLETGFLLGSFCGLPLTIYFVDKIGRKKSLLLASLVVLLAWITKAFGNRIEYIIVARFFCGMSGNMAFVAAPMYLAEIADQEIRGFLSSIIYLMMLSGCLIVYSVGPYLPYYVPCIIGGTVTLAELLIFSNIPESPLYLMSQNKPDLAKKSIEYFRPHLDAEQEMMEISKALEREKNDKGRFIDLVLVESNRKATVIMAVLNAGQHFSAYSVILMNLHLILEAAGSIYLDSSIAAIIFAAFMLLAAGFASLQVDKYGRKVLLIFSSLLTGFCLLAIAIYFHLKGLGYDVLGVSWIPIVSVMVYAAVFKVGVGLVPIVVTAEIFPTNLKAIGMTMADSMFIIGGIVAIQLYQVMSKTVGLFAAFYLFAACSFFITVFTIFCIPETKGKSLEEIQYMLQGKKLITEKPIGMKPISCDNYI